MKILQDEAEIFRAGRRMDGQTDLRTDSHHETNSYFLQFCKHLTINFTSHCAIIARLVTCFDIRKPV